MTTKTLTKVDIKMFTQPIKALSSPTFFELARKNTVKKRAGVSKDLSKNIDKILYGA